MQKRARFSATDYKLELELRALCFISRKNGGIDCGRVIMITQISDKLDIVLLEPHIDTRRSLGVK